MQVSLADEYRREYRHERTGVVQTPVRTTNISFLTWQSRIGEAERPAEKSQEGKMKYLKQFGIIIVISFLGEVLRAVLPLPVPASIYGILLMFFALYFGVLKISDVSETGKFLVEIMAVMFVPAAAGLMKSWGSLQPFFLEFLFICVSTTFIVMGVTGFVTQFVIRCQRKSGKKEQKTESTDQKNGAQEGQKA